MSDLVIIQSIPGSGRVSVRSPHTRISAQGVIKIVVPTIDIEHSTIWFQLRFARLGKPHFFFIIGPATKAVTPSLLRLSGSMNFFSS